MHATSTDGTPIAFDTLGDGAPTVVLVGGATTDRARLRPTAEALSALCTVVNYDRRGRGDSGDTLPYAVEREVEDLAALLDGPAVLYGHSSGSALVLHAAAAGLEAERLVLHEPPYNAEPEEDARAYHRELLALLEQGRRGDAAELFLAGTGMAPEMVAEVRETVAPLAHTLAYDSAAMGDADGGAIPHDLLGRIDVPALVLIGGDSPGWFKDTGRALAAGLAGGRYQELPGEGHVADPARLAEALRPFLQVGG